MHGLNGGHRSGSRNEDSYRALTAGNARRPLDPVSRSAILNHMVYYQAETLNRTFAALADPTRRAMLAHLAEQDGVSVSELARPFAISLPAAMKHIAVLSDAGLVARHKTGRTVECRLIAAPMEEAVGWLHRYQRFWSQQLDRLAAFLEDDACSTSQASPSNESSKRRPRKSTKPGPIRKK
jgi:DNA-binding transcriptional ArsR family regulator